MKLDLLVVKSQGDSSWDDVEQLGTFKSKLERGDRLSFSRKNVNDLSKNVSIMIYEKNEEAPKTLSCTKPLSVVVRKALSSGTKPNAILGVLINLPIIKNSKGTYLSKAAGSTESFGVDELLKEELSFEDLVAY